MSRSASTIIENSQVPFGTLTKGWRLASLQDICEVDKQLVEPSSSLAASLPYISLEHVESNTGRILRSAPEPVEDEGKSTTYLFDERHVLYGKLRPYLNKVALPNFKGRCTTELVPLLPKNDTDRSFLAWVLRRKETVDAAMSQKTGSRMPRADIGNLLTLSFTLPPPVEQKRIASILNEQMAAVERARAAAGAQLEAAASLYTSYLRSVFDSYEAQQWEKKRLGDISIVGPDNGAFKKRHEFGRGVPIVNVLDLFKSLKLDLNNAELVNASQHEQSRYAIASGDLFFCRSSLKREGVGWCCYVEEVSGPAIFECHVMRVRLDSTKALPSFVAHYWRHPAVREEVISSAKTATMTTMNQGDLARVFIPLPSIELQHQIATTLSAKLKEVERLMSIIQTQLTEIKDLPAALLRQAFTGKL